MSVWLRHRLGWLIAVLGSREDLVFENLALRQQLLTLHARRPRPQLSTLDKLFWVVLRRAWSGWRRSLILSSPWIRGAPRVGSLQPCGRLGRALPCGLAFFQPLSAAREPIPIQPKPCPVPPYVALVRNQL